MIESPRVDSIRHWGSLRSAVRANNVPVVFHDGEDYETSAWNVINDIHPVIMLKRELRKNRAPSADYVEQGIRVVGFPFSCPSRAVYEVTKTIEHDHVEQTTNIKFKILRDVVFMCGATAPERQHMARALRSCDELTSDVRISPDADKPEGEDIGLQPWDEYVKSMCQSKFVIGVRGYGLDTLRFWEALPCTVLASDFVGVHYIHPFIDGQTYIEYEAFSELLPKLKHYKENEEERRALFMRQVGHMQAYHTTEARALWLLAQLADSLGWDSL